MTDPDATDLTQLWCCTCIYACVDLYSEVSFVIRFKNVIFLNMLQDIKRINESTATFMIKLK
ncbi:hypothetical protein GLYMA_06G231100v4 [Glycine max]|uniref:Uncharacterized protein n=2 Tax=Glycine subgen. Soja TaxID=1462606 RepID=K7KWU0_SOYBN|nr:hypothetical protein JHK85_016589 [Glycine max]KAG5046814.1 hypothetical protein JHK86_016220 [Glycine max]KAH1127249.1 hypothetical protein GYH30_015998 [Glycine max]KRH55110.1 hypothetical protein GLYMA_06G231100v4 [Glycine max]RZC08830.1 hypothetical protein D0Y65_015508 [Glycine soja]